jgi:hypothetical protein
MVTRLASEQESEEYRLGVVHGYHDGVQGPIAEARSNWWFRWIGNEWKLCRKRFHPELSEQDQVDWMRGYIDGYMVRVANEQEWKKK